MNTVIVTNSTSYEPRAEYVAEFFRRRGHQVLMIESDFFHREKTKGRPAKEGYRYLDTIPYKKNLSAARLYSHYNFAQKAFKELESAGHIDLLYVMVPANSLTQMAARYKRLHPETKLVLDIIDLWPESLPIPVIKNIFPCTVWRDLRDQYLKAADLIFTECRLYQEVLGKRLEGLNVETLYWPKEEKAGETGQKKRVNETQQERNRENLCRMQPEESDSHSIEICYLGSMNNIINIDYIVTLLKEINGRKPVTLHVIGDGESREEFLNKLQQAQIDLRYYGVVYDEEQKREILKNCSYGLNLMKNTVCVGLTMKSVEYLSYGLMLLNNIPGDTWELVEKEKIGYNCTDENVAWVAEMVAACEYTSNGSRCLTAGEKARKLYETLFSTEAFEAQLEKYLL